MIGSKALLFMLFPLLGLVLVTALFVTVLRRGAQWSLSKRVGAMAASVVAASYLIVNISFHLLDYSRVRGFRQEDVVEIEIADRVLTSPQDIRAICTALQTTEWFESRHGGWGEELPLTFKTATGREYTYRVAYYRVHPGVVILHRIGGNGTYLLGDVGFSSELPDVLTRMGIALPQS